jgi:ParB family chromosome partitioning protein
VSLAAEVARLPEEEQAAIASAPQDQMRDVARAVVKAHVANNSGNNEWYTPPEYIAAAASVMGGIDLDPASCEIANSTVGAATFYTAEVNGLEQPWGGRVWMNPPYAQPLISHFSEAVAAKYEAGEIEQACVLVNNGTETGWFQRMLTAADAVCFPKSRIKFLAPDGTPSGAPLQGQAVIYFGPRSGKVLHT